MELPGIFKGLGEKISKLRTPGKITVEKTPDPTYTSALEAISRNTLINLYTDPRALQSLGTMGRTMANFQRSGQQLTRMEEDFGINSNAVPHLTSNLKAEATRAADITALTRKKALDRVAYDRRGIIEQEALLEAQRRLTEKLKEEGLNKDYRMGASEMLRRVEERLTEKTALPEGNPT